MGTLKDQYEATGQGEYVHVGLPEFQADNLVKDAQKEDKEPGPETFSVEAEAWRSRAAVCRDLLNENITPYLTQWEGEEDGEFQTRQEASIYGFVNFYEEAVNGLVDQVFKREVQLRQPENGSQEDADAIASFWADVSRGGKSDVSGTAFTRATAEKSLGMGGTPLILIDYPERVEPASDKAEEDAQGLRPYFHLISPWQVIDVVEDEDGSIGQVRYFSSRPVPHGEWGTRQQTIIVVLDRGPVGGFATRRVLVHNKDTDEWLEDPESRRTFEPPVTASAQVRQKFREVPVVPMPTGVEGFFARPMLRNVANLNVLHYRKRTDYDRAESVASVPMKAFMGFAEDELAGVQWGPYWAIRSGKSPAEASVQDVSFGFETAKISLATLESIERYIAVKSKDPQSQRATGEEKSTIRMLDEGKKISRLQAWALGWLNAVQAALEWAGAWLGIEAVGELAYLDEVFDALDASPGWAEFVQFAALVQPPPEMLIEEAKRYGVISDHWDAKEMAEMIATTGPDFASDSE